MNQAKYHDALTQIEAATIECRVNNELHAIQQLELLQAQCLVYLGSNHTALKVLQALKESHTTNHTTRCVQYVSTLRLTTNLLRTQTVDGSSLQQALVLLEEAEHVLDEMLLHDGWIGVENIDEQRLNVYHPVIPLYIRLKVDLAQTLIECPLQSGQDILERQQRALTCIDQGLKALAHTLKPLVPSQAALCRMKRSILKKMLVSGTVSGTPSILNFDECVSALTGSIHDSVRAGGYNR